MTTDSERAHSKKESCLEQSTSFEPQILVFPGANETLQNPSPETGHSCIGAVSAVFSTRPRAGSCCGHSKKEHELQTQPWPPPGRAVCATSP